MEIRFVLDQNGLEVDLPRLPGSSGFGWVSVGFSWISRGRFTQIGRKTCHWVGYLSKFCFLTRILGGFCVDLASHPRSPAILTGEFRDFAIVRLFRGDKRRRRKWHLHPKAPIIVRQAMVEIILESSVSFEIIITKVDEK